MDNVKILVIDDKTGKQGEEGDRTNSYLILENESIANRPIKIDFATSLEDAANKIRSRDHHLAIIDVVLTGPGWKDKKGAGFKSLVVEANKVMPIAIVSSLWNASCMSYIREIFENDSINLDVRLFFRWDELSKPDTRKLVVLQLSNQISRYHNISKLNRNASESLHIVHLSDLHFGSGKNTLAGAELRRVKDKIFEKWDKGPDFFLVTGDIANTGHPEEYAKAEKWFEELAGLFNFDLPSRRFLIVPGNHDFSIPLAAGSEINIDENNALHFPLNIDLERNHASLYAMTPFQNFIAKLTGVESKRLTVPFRCWIETEYRHHGVIFTGFNTASIAQKNLWPQRHLPQDDMALIEDEVKKCRQEHRTPLFHISLSHHSPIKSKAEEPITNADKYETHLLKTHAKPHLVFHGHEHKRNIHLFDGETLVITAPTPTSRGGRPADNARGFNLIELTRDKFKVDKINVTPFIFDSDEWNELQNIRFQYMNDIVQKVRA